MQFNVQFSANNAAFMDDPDDIDNPAPSVSGSALAEVLRRVADTLEETGVILGGDPGPSGVYVRGLIRDVNGNSVGLWSATR